MANTKISALTALTTPTGNEEFVYAYNNANGKITLDTMKSFVWWAGITTLNADANIWELSEWMYETTYELYYKTWEALPHMTSTWSTWKQMLFVTEESTGERGYFAFNVSHKSTIYVSRACFGHSISASVWTMEELRKWDSSLKQYGIYANVSGWSHPDALDGDTLTQVINNINDDTSNEISISSAAYAWVTYTILVNSVDSWKTYTITLGTWVTNPFGFTLPTNSNKQCVITVVPTDPSTWAGVVTSCTIAS